MNVYARTISCVGCLYLVRLCRAPNQHTSMYFPDCFIPESGWKNYSPDEIANEGIYMQKLEIVTDGEALRTLSKLAGMFDHCASKMGRKCNPGECMLARDVKTVDDGELGENTDFECILGKVQALIEGAPI
jgi:hypothetical protein